jgi:RimJ/RimL family protein N-acetyltransferase
MPMEVPTLRDDVVGLRLPAPRDVDAITDACQDPEIPRFTRVPSPYRRSDAEQFVRNVPAAWEAGNEAVFAIADPVDDSLLGSIGLMRLDDDRFVAEIGYWVAKAARGRGVATRAVRLVSRWAVRDLGVQRLELMTRVENEGSQRVAVAAGFRREGVLRSYITHRAGQFDVVMFSLLPSDLD